MLQWMNSQCLKLKMHVRTFFFNSHSSPLQFFSFRNVILKRLQMKRNPLQRVQRIRRPMDQILEKQPVLCLNLPARSHIKLYWKVSFSIGCFSSSAVGFCLLWKGWCLFSAYCFVPLCLAAHSAVLLKAESMNDKVEWINKIRSVIQPSRGGRGTSNEGGLTMRQSLSDGSLVSFWLMLLFNFDAVDRGFRDA